MKGDRREKNTYISSFKGLFMVKLSEEFIFRLKSVCDIASIVSNYLELKQSGRNRKCCCPFHSEKTPSFFIFEETNSFYCFGCGIGGDVITFIEKIENLEYVEAVRFLCKMSGIEFPEEENIPNEELNLRRKILEINKKAARFFFENLKTNEGKRVLLYLIKKRGLKKKTILKFGLGYSLNSWFSLKNYLVNLGYSLKEIAAADLILRSKKGGFYDKFRGRVMFPIIDLKGDVVGFGARSLEEASSPKYLNSSETKAFKKSTLLYGLNFAKNSRMENFLLCEGYLDVISLHQSGIDSAVATLGTALTKNQTRLLLRHNKEIVLSYDMDLAGKKAAKKASELFCEVGIKAKVLFYEKAKDPDEYIRKFGIDSFEKLISSASTYEKYEIDSLEEKFNLNNLDEKRRYIEEFCKIIAKEKDSLKREIEIGQICQRLSLEKFVISAHVKYLIKKNEISKIKNLDRDFLRERFKKNKQNNGVPQKVINAQEGILRFIYYNPDKTGYIEQQIEKDFFNLEWHKKVFCFLLEAYKEKDILDFSNLREILDEHCLGEFSRIINSKTVFLNTFDELNDYIKILKDYFEEKNISLKDMSLKDIDSYIKKKADLKR